MPQISVAYQNCVLYTVRRKEEERNRRELRRKSRELESLRTVGEAVTEEPVGALEIIASATAKNLGADVVTILPYDDERRMLLFRKTACYGCTKGTFNISTLQKDETMALILKDGQVIVEDTMDLRNSFLPNESDSFIKQVGVRAFVGIRLRVNRETFGILYVNYLKPRSFRKKDLGAITRLATYATIGCRMAKANQTMKEYLLQLATLNSIGTTISSSVTFQTRAFLRLIRDQVGQLMNVENFYVAFYDAKTDSVSFQLAFEDGRERKVGVGEWQTRKTGNGLTEYVIRTKNSLLISDSFMQWCRKHESTLIGSEAKSWLGAPLIARDNVFGVIAVQSYERENEYSEDDREVLTTIVHQTASAILTSRLISQLNETKDELRETVTNTLNNTKDRFAGQLFHNTVAHDILNVFTASDKIFGELLSSASLRQLTPGQQKFIKGLADRILKSQTTVLKFIKLTKSTKAEVDACDLNKIIRQVLDLEDVVLGDRSIDVEAVLGDEIPNIFVSKMQIFMVVFNLVSNGIKALRRVERKRILTIGTRLDGRYLELNVEDNGCGMTKDTRSRLFTPYASSQWKEGIGLGKEGIGLGLFGCKKIIGDLGGSIGVQTRYGKGTTFTVRLPQKLFRY